MAAKTRAKVPARWAVMVPGTEGREITHGPYHSSELAKLVAQSLADQRRHSVRLVYVGAAEDKEIAVMRPRGGLE